MKTKLLCLIWILCGCLPLAAQEKSMEKINENGIYFAPEKLPGFPGGVNELMSFLRTNVKYPVECQQKQVSGRVIVQFVVMEDGSVEMAKVVRGVDPLLDAEALRVVNLMPKWVPGTDKGVPVKVYFTIPIMFRLTGGSVPQPSRDFSIPMGTEIQNKSLEGVWQSCNLESGENKFHVTLNPILKVMSADKTFKILIPNDDKQSCRIFGEGIYEKTSDATYDESIKKKELDSFTMGPKNKITFEFLSDSLMKITFKAPGKQDPIVDYWFRMSIPEENLVIKYPTEGAHSAKGSEPDEKGIYMSADKMPEFSGGTAALLEYISRHLIYPAQAQKKGISGRVIVRFAVMPDGTIDHLEVIKGIDPLLASEAVRVIKGMPKWTPGELNGKKVPVYLTTPVLFVLNK